MMYIILRKVCFIAVTFFCVAGAVLSAEGTSRNCENPSAYNIDCTRHTFNNDTLFSAQEHEWIKLHPVVHVAIYLQEPPLVYRKTDGHLAGIMQGLLNGIGLLTGIRFEYVFANGISQAEYYVKSGRADMIGSVYDYSDVNIKRSIPWVNDPLIMAMPKHVSGQFDINGKIVGLQALSPAVQTLIENYPRTKFIIVESNGILNDMLSKGEIDAYINSQLNSIFYDESLNGAKNGIHDFNVTSFTEDNPVTFGVNSPELLTIINKSLEALPHFNNQNASPLDSEEKSLTILSPYVHMHLVGVILFCILFFVAGLFFFARFIKSRHDKESLEFLDAIIKSMPNAVFIRDAKGILIGCNDDYLKEARITREQALGKKITAPEVYRLLGDVVYEIEKDYMQVINSGDAMFNERQVMISDEAFPRTVLHWLLPFRNKSGQVRGIFGGWININERQQLLQQLVIARDQAEEANKAKTNFLSMMSHEIRTPLHAITGMLEVAISKNASKYNHNNDVIKVAYDAALNLVDLVGDILDVAKIEHGSMMLNPQPVKNIAAIVDSVVTMFRSIADKKGIKLYFTGMDNLLESMLDTLRFRQIISNVIGNAIKFTDEGHVYISLDGQKTKGDALLLNILVRDTGKGIPEDDIDKLFEPFVQANNNQDNDIREGSGLGLNISRTLCNMMNGELELESEFGQGTTVKITLRLPLVSLNVPVSADSPRVTTKQNTQNFAWKNGKILIIDDYLPNRLLLTEQLQPISATIFSACNGEQGFKTWLKDGPFDVVISDINMPIMDGYQLTEKIRSYENKYHHTPVYILGFTASALSEEYEKSTSAGMDDLLFKPSTINMLYDALTVAHDRKMLHEEQQILKLSQLLNKFTSGDKSKTNAMLKMIEQTLLNDIADLDRYLKNKNKQELCQLVHRIKGGASTMNMSSIQACCEELSNLTSQANVCEQILEQGVLQLIYALRQVIKIAQFEPGTLHQPAVVMV